MTDRARVCMVVHEYFPRDFRVRREARALRAAGMAVDILCLKQDGQATTEEIDGLRVTRLPVRRHRGSPLPVYMAEYLAFAAAAGSVLGGRQIREKYDVVHVHAPPDFLVGAGLTGRLGGARLVLDIHDLTPELYGSRFRSSGGKLARQIMQLVERGSCLVADRVITVTEAFKQLLVGRGVAAEKIQVLHNCPDPEAFQPNGGYRRRKKSYNIMHHGTLVHRYGVDLLVDACAQVAEQVAEARLDIYGEGDWLPKLEARLAGDPLTERVCLHGEVSQDVVARALGKADLCVIPNRQDDFTDLLLPTKLLEALHVGCPTIASATKVIAQNFADGGVHLVRPGDVDELAGAMLFLATHPQQSGKLAKAGKLAAKRFSWDTEKNKLLGLYQSLGISIKS